MASAELKLLAIVASAYVCGVVVLCTPRAVPLRTRWALVLDEAERLPDCAAAEALTPSEEALRAAIAAAFAAELGRARERARIAAELAGLRALVAPLLSGHGEGFARVQQVLGCQLARALRGELPAGARDGVLGTFLEQLAEDRVIDDAGRLLLPFSVVKALYAVRVNLLCGLEELRALPPSLARAYTGALAFHLEGASLSRRSWAGARFAELGGAHADEAQAELLVLAGALDEAAVRFAELAAAYGELRARNAAIGLRQRAGAP